MLWSSLILLVLSLLTVAFSECCHGQRYKNVLTRIFTTPPDEGITLLSISKLVSNIYLVNGETDEIAYNYAFRPPSGSSPTDYAMSFTCDNSLIYNASLCSISNVETSIEGLSDTAYNTTVSCYFDRFPGTTQCTLIATLETITVSAISAGFFLPTPPLTGSTLTHSPPLLPANNTVTLNKTTHQSAQYTSTAVTVNVYGLVFYVPDEDDTLSSSATIVSGSDNSYRLDSYDRSSAGVREIRSVGLFEDVSMQGSDGLNFLKSATISTSSSDAIFRYDLTSCSFTENARFDRGALNLNDEENCGLGAAVRDEESYPTLGVQFRPYKSGNFTFEMSWSTLGPLDEEYEQVLVFEITEVAPPVITNLTKLDVYRSTPCEPEILRVRITNVRSASYHRLTVQNEDGTETVWSEARPFFSYNSILDSSTIVFESGGGLGTTVPFNVTAAFRNELRNVVVLNENLDLTLSFTSPPVLTLMSPSTVQISGGETITLTGSFPNFGDDNDFVFVGGLAIPTSQLEISGLTRISFTSPARVNVGDQYIYDVVVARCAEKSNPISLIYVVEPIVSITAVDTSFLENSDAYVVPANGSATYIATVSGNSNGILYSWAIIDSSDTQIALSDTATDEQQFILSSDFLTAEETYQLSLTVENTLGLTDSAEIRLQLAEANQGYIIVRLYPLEPLTRSMTLPTLVQASIWSSSLSELTLLWRYGDETFIVSKNNSVNSQSYANSSITGPTKLGLEFNIARNDLNVGTTNLSLTVTLDSDPSVSGSDGITITVVASALKAVINDGINGTLIPSSSNLALSGEKSKDPDILIGEGDDSAGLSYTWITCTKSLDSKFSTGIEDCTSILPEENTVQSIVISSEDLIAARLDNSTDSDPTFFLFGLLVTKDIRARYSFLYFEFRTVESTERVPTLNSIDIVDRRGTTLGTSDISPVSDIVIQPSAAESIVQWRFDMVLPRQKYLFSRAGVLIVGSGYVSARNQASRLPLGFTGGSLEPATEYKVSVIASANDTSLETSYQVSFSTADVPQLTCSAATVVDGVVSETVLRISAELSYETSDIEYCFYLVSELFERFSVGKGCSSVAFATFTFPREGIYDIECLAKTASGFVLQNVTLDTNISLSLPEQDPQLSQIEVLSQRLANLTIEADKCEAIRDHTCLISLILVADEISVEVQDAVGADTSLEAIQLEEALKEFIQRLSALSEELAANTVYRPNQVEHSVDQTFYLTVNSGSFIEDENTLYSALSQVNGVIGATQEDGTALRSEIIVAKVIGITNVSLTNAYLLDQGGSTRTRLLRYTAELTVYADLLIRLLEYVAQIRKQQEGCGFVGRESTRYPESLDKIKRLQHRQAGLEPCEVNIIIACDVEQIQESLGDVMSGEICGEAVVQSSRSRVEGVLIAIPSDNVLKTGMVSHIDPYTLDMVYVWITGIENIPSGCTTLVLRRDPNKLDSTDSDNLTSGILSPYATASGRGCTQQTCFNLTTSDNDDVIFTTSTITIKTAQQGLIVAGNVTRASSAIFEIPSIEGEGFSGTGVWARAFGIVVAFAAITGLTAWIAVTTSIVTYPDVDDLGWEYVERDMFGRGSVEVMEFSPVAASTASSDGVGSAFTSLANRQSMERRVSTRGGSRVFDG